MLQNISLNNSLRKHENKNVGVVLRQPFVRLSTPAFLDRLSSDILLSIIGNYVLQGSTCFLQPRGR